MNINAIILASGCGTRMSPWSDLCPKVLFKVAGKPMLQNHSQQLLRIGSSKIIVTVHHHYERMMRWCTAYPVLTPYHEETLLGSGGACAYIMDKFNLDRAIIVNGDTWFTDSAYDQVCEKYAETSKSFILSEPPRHYKNGLLRYNIGSLEVEEISEKSGLSDANGRNAGMIILNRSLLEGASGDLMSDAIPGKKIYAIPSEPSLDIGTLENYVRMAVWGRTKDCYSSFTDVPDKLVKSVCTVFTSGVGAGIFSDLGGLRG